MVIHKQKNGGVSSARNKGIDLAQGDYICFVDVDDEITETYISDMIDIFNKYRCQMVICRHVQVPSNKDYRSYLSDKKKAPQLIDKNNALKAFLFGTIITGIWTIMIKTEIIKNNRLKFAEGYKYSEDLHMVWRLILNCEYIVYLNKQLYIYRMQEGSATSRFNEERFQGYELIKSLEKVIEEKTDDFALIYKKYAAARMIWSIMWQAATYYNKDEFIDYAITHNARKNLRKLVTYKNLRVSLSSTLFLLSKTLFYYLSRFFGKAHVRT